MCLTSVSAKEQVCHSAQIFKTCHGSLSHYHLTGRVKHTYAFYIRQGCKRIKCCWNDIAFFQFRINQYIVPSRRCVDYAAIFYQNSPIGKNEHSMYSRRHGRHTIGNYGILWYSSLKMFSLGSLSLTYIRNLLYCVDPVHLRLSSVSIFPS